MAESLCTKGKSIGAGRTLVCVPVVASTRKEILACVERLTKKQTEMIEWRVDWFESAGNPEEVLAVQAEISKKCPDTILLCTFRTKNQGGERKLSPEAYRDMILALAQSGNGDLVDVEACEYLDAKSLIAQIQEETAAGVVASDHHFFETPSTEVMVEKLCYMRRLGADIAKLAVMPKAPMDVLRLMETTIRVKERYPGYPLITMAMGKAGVISRISGSLTGSCVTFGSEGKSSAPGQLPAKEMAAILDMIEGME